MSKAKVIVVDDEAKVREYFSDVLRHEDFNVNTAQNGEIAINMIDQDFYDVALIDLNMPKVDGFQVLERVKQDRRLKKMPVIVLTSSSRNRDIDRAYELGCNSYIVKPVGYENFLRAVIDINRYWLILCEIPK